MKEGYLVLLRFGLSGYVFLMRPGARAALQQCMQEDHGVLDVHLFGQQGVQQCYVSVTFRDKAAYETAQTGDQWWTHGVVSPLSDAAGVAPTILTENIPNGFARIL